MKCSVRKRPLSIMLLLAAISAALCAFAFATRSERSAAYAEEPAPAAQNECVVVDRSQEVYAEFTFVRLGNGECSARIADKANATIAVVPKTAVIDGVTYSVTEIAANGFMSSPKLKEVKLLSNIKKIGSSAFGNCASLEKVSLGNVEAIEKNAFYRCPKLKEFTIPRSVQTLGANVFRYNDTLVRARADSAGFDWSATWNNGNANQDVEFGSTYKEPLELEPVYAANARARSTVFVGYAVAGGQPRTESYYEEEGDNIFIPSKYGDEDIIGIADGAFYECSFDKLVVEYAERPIYLGFEAFAYSDGNSVIINRSIVYEDAENNLPISGSIFSESQINSAVLPDDLGGLANSMFYGCENLTNIYFISPEPLDRETALSLADKAAADATSGVVHLPQSESFTFIEGKAFDSATAIRELHIYDNVKNVGPDITAFWTDSQKVCVHNDNGPIVYKENDADDGWHIDCFVAFDNVTYTSIYYTVTLDFADGATQPEKRTVKLNAPIGVLPRTERAYYTFNGWLGDDGNYYDETTVYAAERDMTLTAQWSAYTYTVEYVANYPSRAKGERSGDMEPTVHTYGTPSPLGANAFTLQGWKFKGWNTSSDGNGAEFKDEQSVAELNPENDGKTVLYAQWEAEEYKIFYFLDGGTNHADNKTVFQADEDFVLLDPTKENEKFLGWYTSEDLPISSTSGIYDHLSVTAKWDNKGPQTENINVNTTDTGLYLSADKVNLYLQDEKFVGTCSVKLKKSVKELNVFGHNGVEYDMYIYAEDRDSDLAVTLKDCIVVAPDGHDAISMTSDHLLKLKVSGNCSIRGGDNESLTTALNKNGRSGIRCTGLMLTLESHLTIIGGNGAKGYTGANGTPNGGNGGVGGKGGNAVYASESVWITGECTLTVQGGNGGDGGNGGIGIATSTGMVATGGKGGAGGASGTPILGTVHADAKTNIVRVNGKSGSRGSDGYISTTL